jgi:type II secretory pathway pseudopilin PulG
MSARQEQGSVWVILVVLVAVVVGSWQFSEYKARNAQKAEAERARDTERAALERRLAQEKAQLDVLTTSSKALDSLLARWDDAVKLASTTSRISLPVQVAALQDIRRDASALTVPPCMDEAKVHLVNSMQATIDAFMAFMANEDKLGDVFAKEKFDEAKADFAEFESSRMTCSQVK